MANGLTMMDFNAPIDKRRIWLTKYIYKTTFYRHPYVQAINSKTFSSYGHSTAEEVAACLSLPSSKPQHPAMEVTL